MKTKFSYGRTLLAAVAFIMLLVGVQAFKDRGLAGGMPPPLHGVTLDGTVYDGPTAYGRPAVIYFWASWCGVCRAMENTVRVVGRDVPMVTVALQSGDVAEVKRYVAEQGFALPVVVDADGAMGKAYGLRGVPAAFILGPDGTIRFATVGYTSEMGMRFRLWLAGWLPRSGGSNPSEDLGRK